ncbi:MAG: carboxymuconolactone decarboxylase family protein [Burkholderiales bacterium]|nr:carboxymuconolactone decarboxylase family protein [Burkholderiales bacterium]
MPDPVLPRVPRAAMTERLQKDYDASLALRDDATLIEVGANAPELMDWYRDAFYGKVFYGGRVDVRTKELLRYRLSMTHGCAYCNRGNSAAARKAGVGEEQLARIMDENAPVFDARDRAVLRLADQVAMTNMHGHLDADLYAALRAHFDDAQIFELGLTAGFLTGMAKFIFVYDLVEKEANCPVRPRVAA